MRSNSVSFWVATVMFAATAGCAVPSDEDTVSSPDEEVDELAELDAVETLEEQALPRQHDDSNDSDVALKPMSNENPVDDLSTASASCPWYALCGDLYNRSGGHQIRIANNWCVSDWTYETWGDWSCGSQMELPNGRNSDEYSGFGDTDAFRAYQGCVTEGYIYTAGGGNIWFTYDRRGKSSLWLKFADVQDVTITRISC